MMIAGGRLFVFLLLGSEGFGRRVDRIWLRELIFPSEYFCLVFAGAGGREASLGGAHTNLIHIMMVISFRAGCTVEPLVYACEVAGGRGGSIYFSWKYISH